MRNLLLVSALLSFCFPAISFAASAYDLDLGRYHALIITNQNYQQLSPLRTPHGDADALANILRTDYGFRVTMLRDSNRAGTLDALDQLVEKLTPSDNLLIFYAGHGHLDKATGEGYWLPVTANPRRRSEWISNSDITDTLRATVAKHVLIISDSCFSGTLSRSASAGLNVGADKRNYYKRLASRVSRTALSSGGLEPVDDGGASGHSVFAGALITALRRNNEQILEAENLYTQIKRPVALNSSAIQKPQYADVRETGHDEGDFLFFKRNVPFVAKPALATKQETSKPVVDSQAAYELAFWDSIESSQDARDYKAYLDAYPQGRFAGLARLRTRQLGGVGVKQNLSNKKEIALVTTPKKTIEKIIKNSDAKSDVVLVVLATPEQEYSPQFNSIEAYSNAIAQQVKKALNKSSLNYLAKLDIARKVIQEDAEHKVSKQLCQQYQAQRVMSIELNLTRDIEEMVRTSDTIYIGLFDCKQQRYSLNESSIDFQNGEEFAYAAGIRNRMRIYNQASQ